LKEIHKDVERNFKEEKKMRINHNISAMNTYRQFSSNTNAQAKNMEKLSTGMRINRGADDAAGLSISEKMRSQIRGLDQASRNAQDGVSMIQTADGALNEVHSILQRMRELAVQASSDTNQASERTTIGNELAELGKEITSIKTNTTFNGQKLLDGTAGDGAGAVKIQTGADTTQQMDMNFKTAGIDITSIETAAGALTNADVTDAATATALIATLDTQITTISTGRSTLGAYQNRLEFNINNVSSASQNLSAAESRIRDVDMAKEMMESSKNGILAQAAQAMLGQANQQPQGVLQLLR
jgi:flagellin